MLFRVSLFFGYGGPFPPDELCNVFVTIMIKIKSGHNFETTKSRSTFLGPFDNKFGNTLIAYLVVGMGVQQGGVGNYIRQR